MKLFLIGLPGSGKSTLGKQIARQLDLPFFDLDDIIESKAKQPIREIFAKRGEGYFRESERSSLLEVITQTPAFVLATGGGAPCFFDNMQQMNLAGTTIFVDTPISVIAERMKKEGVEARPLLHDLDAGDFADTYYRKFAYRLPYYQQAAITVTLASDISSILEKLKT